MVDSCRSGYILIAKTINGVHYKESKQACSHQKSFLIGIRQVFLSQMFVLYGTLVMYWLLGIKMIKIRSGSDLAMIMSYNHAVGIIIQRK